jgi:hypothetical protein
MAWSGFVILQERVVRTELRLLISMMRRRIPKAIISAPNRSIWDGHFSRNFRDPVRLAQDIESDLETVASSSMRT